jgi:hypothetical protein
MFAELPDANGQSSRLHCTMAISATAYNQVICLAPRPKFASRAYSRLSCALALVHLMLCARISAQAYRGRL